MQTGDNYTMLYSGGYAARDVQRLRGLSETAMRYLVVKDIKGSGYDTTKDNAGNYVCAYAREREQVLWDKWRLAQLPTTEQLKIIQAKFKLSYLSQHLHNLQKVEHAD